MGLFNKFGDIIIRLFSLIGSLILAIPHLPEKIRNLNRDEIKEKMKTEEIKENLSQIKDVSKKKVSEYQSPSNSPKNNTPEDEKVPEDDVILISVPFSSEEKERTIFILQIVSAGFLFLSIIHIFNFISLPIYLVLGIVLAGYIIYTLFKRVKLMYGPDFNAYRDFFLMYLLVGLILVLVGNNPNVVMAFSFEFFPSLSILIFAVVAVMVVFLIFRIRYSRNFTYGKVIEAGENTAYVKVDYDIRANVKPDLYIVDNHYGTTTGDDVKLKVEEKILSGGGNKPVSILETVEKI